MKRWGCLALLGVILCFGSGCMRQKTGVPVVCQIRVVNAGAEQVYREPEKMQLILNRLRSLGQCYQPKADPELLEEPAVTITVLKSDGQSRQYQLKADRYICFDRGPWKQTEPGPLLELRLLLYAMPGDDSPNSPLDNSASAVL